MKSYLQQIEERAKEIASGKTLEASVSLKKEIEVEKVGDIDLPPYGRIWRITSKTGRVGWSVRYGIRHNREFVDVNGDEQESRRKAVDFLWSQYHEFGGNPGGVVRSTRWPRERVVECARLVLQRTEALFRMSHEELVKECRENNLSTEKPIQELIDHFIMVVFELD